MEAIARRQAQSVTYVLIGIDVDEAVEVHRAGIDNRPFDQAAAPEGLDPALKAEVDATAKRKRELPPAAVDESLLPPLRMEMPDVRGQAIDAKFDLAVQNAPAAQVFASLVAGTRYSMLLHPGVSGNITLNLKDVSLREALDAIRELYGYEYKIEGMRIFVQAAGLQTRVFHVNYLPGQRRGVSDLRVQSGAPGPIWCGRSRARSS